jgi:4,5-DOPA dioxygenase extradiol
MPDPYDWAIRFDRDAKEMMVAGEYKPFIEYEKLGPEALLSIPTPDHYLPMLYVIATKPNRRRRWRIDFDANRAGGLGR